MRRKLIYFLATLVIVSCDPVDTKLKVINNFKDSTHFQVGPKIGVYYEFLSITKKQWEKEKTTVEFSNLGDTLIFGTIGNWNGYFSGPNDSLLIFATERKNLINFFESKIERDSTCRIFVVTYKDLLYSNWIISISDKNKKH